MSFPFPRFRVTKPPSVLVSSPRPGPGTFSSARPGQQPGQLPAVTLALPAVVRQLALYMIMASQTVFTLGKIKMPRNKMVHSTTGRDRRCNKELVVS